MTYEELSRLKEPDIISAIEQNIERNTYDVALDNALCHSSLIASQVKYLQRARTKLPEYYAARCIIPKLAFEQSSSEAAARVKSISGESALELTCGLGVDAASLSRRFNRVVTIERDEIVAEVARENFKRLGLSNIEVVTASAEEFLASCNDHFDWIYVDPDRRSSDGKKIVILEECSPNIIAIWSDIERVASRVAVKCSPLFDVDEAFNKFGGCRVESVSLGDECKEVMIYIEGAAEQRIGATAIGEGEVWLSRDEAGEVVAPQEFDTERYSHIIIPNVALLKSRIARRVIGEIADIYSDNGVGFMSEEQLSRRDSGRHLGRVMQIDWIGDYDPKKIRKELTTRGITRAEVWKRDSRYSVDQITKQLKIKEGGSRKIVVTKVGNRQIFIILAE